MENKMIKTLLAVPHYIVQSGIERVLFDIGGFRTNIASDFDSMQSLLRANKYDIVILDPAIIMGARKATMDDIASFAKDSVLIGVKTSFLPEDAFKPFAEIIDIADAKADIIRKLTHITEADTGKNDDLDCELSAREKEVLVAIAKGMLNKEIADMLHISIHTVMSHRKNIQQKTNIKTASGLTIYAIVKNLVSPQELGVAE